MKLEVNGQTAYAYTGGKPFDPALPCIVFIHGALNDHSVWTLLARWCAHHGQTVLAVDLPGHGRSGGLPLADVAAHAAWLWTLLDALGVARAALVGHSMGSLIALEAAAGQAARTTALVMVGTAYPMKVSAALLNTSRDAPQQAIEMVNEFSHSTLAPKPAYPGPGAWLRGGSRALMQRLQACQSGVNLFEHDFKVCDAYAGGEAAAAAVAAAGLPVSFVLADRDQMTVPKQSALLAGLLKPRVFSVAGGHQMMSEAPEQMLAALRGALALDQPNS